MKAIMWLGVISVMTNGTFAQGTRQQSPRQVERSDINRAPNSAPLRPRPRPTRPIFPLGFGGYGFGGYDYDYGPPSPNVVFVEPPPPPPYGIIPERPPEPATLVIHEYQPLSPAAAQASDADQPMFAIALKDGTILSASAVIVQNDGLHIVDPDGAHQRVSLDRVDREATKRINRERKLQLQLPPEH